MRIDEQLGVGVLDESQLAALYLSPSENTISLDDAGALEQVDRAQERVVAEALCSLGKVSASDVMLDTLGKLLALRDVYRGLGRAARLPSPVPGLSVYRAEDWTHAAP